jgi:hypothetical protein
MDNDLSQDRAIVRHPKSDSGSPSTTTSTTCFILKLPDETLDEIISIAASNDEEVPGDRDHRKRWETCLNVSLVCRRFNQIATPHLYTNITFPVTFLVTYPDKRRSHVPRHNAERSKALRSTLVQHPELWKFCHTLSLTENLVIERPIDERRAKKPKCPVQWSNNMLSWMTEIRRLDLAGLMRQPLGYQWAEQRLNRFLQILRTALPQFRRLESVEMYSTLDCWDVNSALSRELFTAFETHPSLKRLTICGTHPYFWHSSRADLTQGAAGFTELEVGDFHGSIDGIKRLLYWPEKLITFSIDRVGPSSVYGRLLGHVGSSNLKTLCDALLRHKNTLRSLSVLRGPAHCTHGIQVGFVTSLWAFNALTHLTLGDEWIRREQNIMSHIAPLAPALRSFRWVFTGRPWSNRINRLGTTIWSGSWLLPPGWTDATEFGKFEEDWLYRMVDAAEERHVPLRRITVDMGETKGCNLLSYAHLCENRNKLTGDLSQNKALWGKEYDLENLEYPW